MRLSRANVYKITYAPLFLFLVGCETSPNAHDGPPSSNAETQSVTLSQTDIANVLATDGKPLENVIRAIEDTVEARVLSGQTINVLKLQSALDAALTIHCDQSCAVTLKEAK